MDGVQLQRKFRVDDPELQGGAVLIDEGDYKAVILGSGIKENKARDGSFIELKIVITEGKYKDTEFVERLNVINKNPTAEKIAYSKLAQISSAVGLVETPDNTKQLHNMPFLISVKTDAARPYDKVDPMTGLVTTQPGSPQSSIKKYSALPSVGLGGQQPAFGNTVAAAQQYAPPAAAPMPAQPSWAAPSQAGQ